MAQPGEQKSINTFQGGINLDMSDMVMSNKIMRYAENIRYTNLIGSDYVISQILGNEVLFQLTAGFVPIATQEFGQVLYIVSWCADPNSPYYKMLELGSYPSPNYGTPSTPNSVINVYRPLNNLDATGSPLYGPFRTLAYELDTKPVIQKLEIQPDYDESSNMVFTIVGKKPRIVNTKFSLNKAAQSIEFKITEPRTASANSNDYQSGGVDKETSLILFSDKVLKIVFNGVQSGGKLKPGNYQYVFQYMTEDFNKTGVIGQSLVCQISNGNTENTLAGGDETQQTTKMVALGLTSVDTNFAYFKVHALYSSGQEGLQQQTLEFTQPIPITGATMTFNHSGYEDLAEVSADTVNVDYALIESANAGTQIGNYYIIGGIIQRNYDFRTFKDAAALITPVFKSTELPTGVLPGYGDPDNTYNRMGYFGGESYPFGVVFVLPGNQLSPTFPVAGRVFLSSGTGNEPSVDNTQIQDNGVITFPQSHQWRPYHTDKVRVKNLEFDLSGISQTIKDNSLGFFFVRGERRPWMLTQGIMIPTLRVPPIEYLGYKGSPYISPGDNLDTENYYLLNSDLTDTNRYKHIPCLDNLIEAWYCDAINTGTDDDYVVDANLQEQTTGRFGRMPIFINDWGAPPWPANYPRYGAAVTREMFSPNHWAFYSGEALLNEPYFVPNLRRDAPYIHQLGKVNFRVGGAYPHVYNQSQLFHGTDFQIPRAGMWYNMESIENTGYGTGVNWVQNFKKANLIDFVVPETFATGSKFISKVRTRFKADQHGSEERGYDVGVSFNAYFGIEMVDTLVDSTKAVGNPLAGNYRLVANGTNVSPILSAFAETTSGVVYDNMNRLVPGAFLVNVYPDNTVPYVSTGIGHYKNRLFPTVDNISYRQCSPWYSWSDLPQSGAMTNKVRVYGGDCYITKVSRRLYQSGFRDASTSGSLVGDARKQNIDAGMLVSWWQESKYNTYLRQPKQFDDTELEKRSFFPYKNSDPIIYQKYRLPETTAHSPGYSEVLPPKVFFNPPDLAPFIENQFFSRVYHSERHIPSAFKNGYRSFLQTSFRDYDSSMGAIIGLFNHRGKLLIIFQHGIGMTEIEQRVPVGGDAAGQIFIEPSSVLPVQITYVSKEIGCQDNLAMVQTPGGIYGIDRSKDKLWRMSDNFQVISDNVVASFLVGNIVNPRMGYDLQYFEVLFTTDNWTLVWKEGLNQFASFYSAKPNFYARRTKEMYSFTENIAWKHNAPVYSIYGTVEDSIVEFVLNENLGATKVIDYLNIISNEIAPVKVEFYSYNQGVQVGHTIDPAATNQYAVLNNVFNTLRDEFPIRYRDKKFVLQAPVRSNYGAGSDMDNWSIEGRVRDKYIIVRLTYNTQSPLELASVISSFRYSQS